MKFVCTLWGQQKRKGFLCLVFGSFVIFVLFHTFVDQIQFIQFQASLPYYLQKGKQMVVVAGLGYSSQEISLDTSKPFKILFWTSWYGQQADKQPDYWFDYCKDEIIVTSNRSELQSADAIIFALLDLPWVVGLQGYQLPEPRDPNVPWIVSITEAPNWYPKIHSDFNGVFNWTWSYNIDSDFAPPYMSFYEKMKTPDERWIYGSHFANEFLGNKTKLVAWVVSNCNSLSRRTDVVEALEEKGISIDIYGKCGKSCPDEKKCFETLGTLYKFYLAFENALCVDYASEKVHHGLQYGMVPITLGLGNYSHRIPPGSWIDSLDYDSIESLVNKIKFLNKSPEAYFRYFEWRKVYSIEKGLVFSRQVSGHHCQLWKQIRKRVKLIKEHGQEGLRHVHKNFTLWYNNFYNPTLGKYCGRCTTPPKTFNGKQIKESVFNNSKSCL